VNWEEIGKGLLLVAVNAGILPEPVVNGKPVAGSLLLQVYVVLLSDEANRIGAVLVWLHTICGNKEVITGIGLITTLKLILAPTHVLEMGVTVITLARGAVETFMGVKGSILPIPAAGIPMAELTFVHEYKVPATLEPLNRIGPNCLLPQVIKSATG
jgi:hypothetical protein